MSFDYKNILIMGYGKSGLAVEEILKRLNVAYKIYDADKKITGGNYYAKLSKKIVEQFDLLVVSPGISVYNKFVIYAEKIGIKVVGELEFGYWFTSSPVIAITGTNGKTTTTRLINDIVGTTFTSDAFGNIGKPLSQAYNKDYNYLVCEVSSFQLETTYSFKPYISVLLNIAEDHLDRHKTFDNYINCKIGLLKNCNEKSIVVLNYDDKLIMNKTEGINVRKYYISKFNKVKGVYIFKQKIFANICGKPIEIMNVDKLEDNFGIIDDVLASILVGLLLKIDKEKIIDAILNFQMSPHRLQFVTKHNGVTFIDDSKSTNIHSAKHALSTISNQVVLLLGGLDKNLSFDEIFRDCADKLDMVIAFGNARNKIQKSAKRCKFENIKVCKSFRDAVKCAYEISKENQVVLLSPACSSFDEFTSYAERGEVFVELVKELSNAKN